MVSLIFTLLCSWLAWFLLSLWCWCAHGQPDFYFIVMLICSRSTWFLLSCDVDLLMVSLIFTLLFCWCAHGQPDFYFIVMLICSWSAWFLLYCDVDALMVSLTFTLLWCWFAHGQPLLWCWFAHCQPVFTLVWCWLADGQLGFYFTQMLVCSWLAWLLLFVLMLEHSNQGRICSPSHQCLTELIVPVISVSVGGGLIFSTCRQYLSWCLIFSTCHPCLTEVTDFQCLSSVFEWLLFNFQCPSSVFQLIVVWFPAPIISVSVDCCLISSACHQHLNWLLFDFQRLSSVFELIVVWFPVPVISIWIDCCFISSACHQNLTELTVVWFPVPVIRNWLSWLLFDFQRLSSEFDWVDYCLISSTCHQNLTELIVVWFPAPVISPHPLHCAVHHRQSLQRGLPGCLWTQGQCGLEPCQDRLTPCCRSKLTHAWK